MPPADRSDGRRQAHEGDPALDTADFGDDPASGGPGNLRVDYVLPSRDLDVLAAQIFWPTADDPLPSLITASDHRLVWVDVVIGGTDARRCGRRALSRR